MRKVLNWIIKQLQSSVSNAAKRSQRMTLRFLVEQRVLSNCEWCISVCPVCILLLPMPILNRMRSEKTRKMNWNIGNKIKKKRNIIKTWERKKKKDTNITFYFNCKWYFFFLLLFLLLCVSISFVYEYMYFFLLFVKCFFLSLRLCLSSFLA